MLKLYIELKDGHSAEEADVAAAVYSRIMTSETDELNADSPLRHDFAGSIDFSIDVTLLGDDLGHGIGCHNTLRRLPPVILGQLLIKPGDGLGKLGRWQGLAYHPC